MHGGFSVWWVAGLTVLFLLGALIFQLSPTARLRRRRRKSHTPLISKARRPMVKFSVRTPRKK